MDEKYTQDIINENMEYWIELWEKNQNYIIIDDKRYKQCDLCKDNNYLNSEIIFHGPMNSNIPSKCTHWACVDCWNKRFENYQYKCPWCHEDLRAWMEYEIKE